ncbi:MAG: hypothetical protein ACK4IB_06670 [Erythrobacter sp.]
MSTPTRREQEETRARQRYLIMNVARLGGVALLMFGIAITQGVVDLPFSLGVVLAMIGFVDFFALPLVLARAWKSQDSATQDKPKQ